ncbi:MAG TPA: outer membrane beta-barrel protein [Candidatus Acidoferrales bacterium]|nr:outer membrane beta-barrel protein [Candidatus Acidoferrales bacterium]
MGLAIFCTPASHAKGRLAGDEAGSGSEANAAGETSAPSTSAASSPADLRERIDALKAELAKLNDELAAKKDEEPAASAAEAPQDQSGPPPATPPAAAAPAAAAPAPMPLPSPSMAGPLATGIPHELPAGPFGKIEVTGILSGMAWTEGEYTHISGLSPQLDAPTHYDISNAQVFIQKTTGWWQFYLQAGAYNLPAVGVPFLGTPDTVKGFYGPFPQGYLKLVKGNFNVEIGALPTQIGAEYTFSFENMNIERGILWNQENAVERGIQLSDTYKKLTLTFGWNDGFYSNRYSWLQGTLAYAFNASNTLSFVGMGNAGAYAKNTAATPLFLNNSDIYNLLYTYTHGTWVINPYYQYTVVKANPSIGIPVGAHTNGGAILVTKTFKHGFSLAVRPEYIKSTGPNLLYGPDTGAFAFTATPTYVKDAFFIRGDVSVVHATNFNATTGFAFGLNGTSQTQPRGVIEAGFLF